MNKEISAFQKRFSLENYCKTDDEFWATVNNRVIDLPGEEWRTIPGWCCFEVSNLGRVKRPLQERCYGGGSYPVLYEEKLLKPYKNKNGYLMITLNQFSRRGTFYIHRLVLSAFEVMPPTSAHTEVNHKNQNPLDNRLVNLEWVTPNENLHYGDRAQRVSNGLIRYYSRLSEEEKSKQGKRAAMTRAKKIICDGVIYPSLKDFCEHNDIKVTSAWNYLNGVYNMPPKWKNKGLKYINE